MQGFSSINKPLAAKHEIMPNKDHQVQASIDRLCQEYQALPMVEAIVLGGSRTSAFSDDFSDVDIYIYSSAEVPVADRAGIALQHSIDAEIDNRNWEPGDEWIEAGSGLHFDIMFRDCRWIEQQLDRLFIRHQPGIGYSTCVWYNVLNSGIWYDPEQWFAGLQQQCRQPYPEPLRRAIIDQNYPLLSKNLSSYRHQLELAVGRRDIISLQHRTTAFLASYFDIIFALNRMPHPGEKRLLEFCAQCELLPGSMQQQLEHLIRTSVTDPFALADAMALLLESLDQLLSRQGFSFDSG